MSPSEWLEEEAIYAVSFGDEVTRPRPVNNAISGGKNVYWFD